MMRLHSGLKFKPLYIHSGMKMLVSSFQKSIDVFLMEGYSIEIVVSFVRTTLLCCLFVTILTIL